MPDKNKIVVKFGLSDKTLKFNHEIRYSMSVHDQRVLLEYDTDGCNSMTLVYAHLWSNPDVSQQKD